MMRPPEMGYKPVNESQPIGFGETIIDMAYNFAKMSVDDNGVLDLDKFERKITELRTRAVPLPGTINITEEELMQYALLHAEAHSADTDSLGKIHQRAKEFENVIRSRTAPIILPTDEEMHALKQAVCFAIQMKVDGFAIADSYYHKLKDLRGGP